MIGRYELSESFITLEQPLCGPNSLIASRRKRLAHIF